MIDSHCHIDLPAFDNDRLQILHACRQVGIERLLVPGLSVEQFTTLRALRADFPHQIHIALGCHPYFLKQLEASQQKVVHEHLFLLGHQYQEDIVAIGECGLDAVLSLPMAYQQEVLSWHINLASELNLPLILHHRKSHNELIKILKQKKFKGGGVVHAFSGSVNTAQTYVDLGFKLGVGGTITYPRASKTIATIKHVSLAHLVLETDSPDMPLNGFQGQRNSPIKLELVAQCLATLKGIDLQEVMQTTTRNYYDIFE